MGRHTIYGVAALTFIWIILTESLVWQNILVGVAVSIIVMVFIKKNLPFKKINNVDFSKLAGYPFYLIGQVYLAGFQVIKIILTGPKIEIITVTTKITDDTLKIILVDSITLTPGSILLELNGDQATLLWIRDKNSQLDSVAAGQILEDKLERKLLRAQKGN